MKKLPTISIGILAYNEEKAISQVLADVYSQKVKNAVIKEVIVFSDGSDDNTVPIVKSLQHENLKLIDKKQRKGMVAGLNGLCEASTGDCLIILNADIRIKDSSFVEKLALPVVNGEADLTSCDQVPLEPSTFVERALVASVKAKTAAFEAYKDGDNVYTCHGTARAFSKKLYKKINFPHSVGEDAYAFLFATFNNFKYHYVKNTVIYFRLPTHYQDHYKQSTRFNQSRSQFVEEFGQSFVNESYYLPPALLLEKIFKTFLTHPISMTAFVGMFLLIKLTKPKKTEIGNTWDVVLSTKETK